MAINSEMFWIWLNDDTLHKVDYLRGVILGLVNGEQTIEELIAEIKQAELDKYPERILS